MTIWEWGDLALVVCAAITILFVLLYASIAPWWKSWKGWNIMAWAVCLVLMLLLSTASIAFGDWYNDVRPYARVVVPAVIILVVVHRIYWLLSQQIKGGRE